jgi:hypothetical protein
MGARYLYCSFQNKYGYIDNILINDEGGWADKGEPHITWEGVVELIEKGFSKH